MSSTSNVPEPNFKAILAAQMGNVKGIFKARIKQAKKVVEIMENAVKLEVPNKVDYESGKNWGDIYD